MKKDFSHDKAKEDLQEKVLLERINQVLLGKTDELEKVKEELEQKLSSQTHKTKELEQEQILLTRLNIAMEKKLNIDSLPAENPNLLIDKLLSIHKEISLLRLTEFTKINQSQVSDYLEDLESKGIVTKLDSRKEMVCRECSSTKLELSFHCPKCKNTNYAQNKLFEHYSCGNVSLEFEYVSDKCPKCRKTIKAHGLDFRSLDCYVCDNCNDKFNDPHFMLKCINCNAFFDREHVKWKTSPRFKLN